MDYHRDFVAVLHFLEEFYHELLNPEGDSARFFQTLDEEVLRTPFDQVMSTIAGALPARTKEAYAASLTLPTFVPTWREPSSSERTQGFHNRMSLKKLHEITNYGDHVMNLPSRPDQILEVACGHGHLGNHLALLTGDHLVHGVDLVEGYVAAANKKAQDFQTGATFAAADAMSDLSGHVVGDRVAAIGLHACTYLSQQILRMGTDAVMVSPCCYHKFDPQDYFMSSFGQATVEGSTLWADPLMGQIANLGPNSATDRHIRVNQKSIKRNLEQRGYTQTPEEIALFEQLGVPTPLVTPDTVDAAAAYIDSVRRRWSLAKKIFSSGIEHLFSLDKAIYLGEHGYNPSASQFVPRELSPRNHLIVGYR